MNKSQVKVHSEVIKWFCTGDNADKGVWYRWDSMNPKWHKTTTPEWDMDVTYVQNDEYAELRKLVMDKPETQLEVSYNNGISWYPKSASKAFLTIEENKQLRVKPDEPEFKAGDWVQHRQGEKIQVEIYDTHTDLLRGYKIHEWKLWQPTEGEYVCCRTIDPFLEDYIVFKYVSEYHSKNREVLPLEFVSTLKDK